MPRATKPITLLTLAILTCLTLYGCFSVIGDSKPTQLEGNLSWFDQLVVYFYDQARAEREQNQMGQKVLKEKIESHLQEAQGKLVEISGKVKMITEEGVIFDKRLDLGESLYLEKAAEKSKSVTQSEKSRPESNPKNRGWRMTKTSSSSKYKDGFIVPFQNQEQRLWALNLRKDHYVSLSVLFHDFEVSDYGFATLKMVDVTMNSEVVEEPQEDQEPQHASVKVVYSGTSERELSKTVGRLIQEGYEVTSIVPLTKGTSNHEDGKTVWEDQFGTKHVGGGYGWGYGYSYTAGYYVIGTK